MSDERREGQPDQEEQREQEEKRLRRPKDEIADLEPPPEASDAMKGGLKYGGDQK